MSRIIWGSVNANGSINSGSKDFRVERTDTGKYVITFNTQFSVTPAVVATQNNFGDSGQSNMDGVSAPFVNAGYCQINTGDNSNKFQDRSFGFIAIGS
ncbi:hypothetical protein [Burkholderia sp. BDU5]|uniref:hypothetical protein n=1 Tax=Burkholderia sp. BDU5 TaxID=1385590 RepID=UPI0012E3545C|nr:hypothetical protein [Burkholderia sp. BDU5]